eukprot:2155213-Alexandrium_andersonii.AAC.1
MSVLSSSLSASVASVSVSVSSSTMSSSSTLLGSERWTVLASCEELQRALESLGKDLESFCELQSSREP